MLCRGGKYWLDGSKIDNYTSYAVVIDVVETRKIHSKASVSTAKALAVYINVIIRLPVFPMRE